MPDNKDNPKDVDRDGPDEELVQGVKSTAQLDLERRLENGNAVAAPIETLSPMGTEEAAKEDYIGTDPVYQNYANDTEKPLVSEDGGFKMAEEAHLDALAAEAKEPSDEIKDFYNARSTNLNYDQSAPAEAKGQTQQDEHKDTAAAKKAKQPGADSGTSGSSSGSSGS